MPGDMCISLEIPPETDFACPVAGLANALAVRAGFDRRENYRFQLAVEEFCLYLAGFADGNQPLSIGLTGKRHQMRASFAFRAANLSLGALNITSRATSGTLEASSAEMGLLLVGKAADRFRLEHHTGDRFVLEAEVDRAYPEVATVRRPEGWCPPFAIRTQHDPAQLTQAAALAMSAYPRWQCPGCFRTPAKFPDMVADGAIACVLACDARGQTVGLLSWAPCSGQALLFSGPFVFTPPETSASVARLLVDGFLETVAREPYNIVFSFRATSDLPKASFETLGSLQSFVDGRLEHHPIVFRHLREDNGLAVWCPPQLERFLRQAYDRLALSRDILPVEKPTARPQRASLLGAAYDPGRNLAELTAFLDGEDMTANLAAHVAAFRRQGIGAILYHMDLSVPWEAALASDLIQAGFTPVAILPQGGRTDKVVWQHEQLA
ncbi:hypothetical protein G3N56_01980 [Desulfovibrio sulfodismutans]|uniref:Uncharacterized protein n=1 Tax=Desulfolutivibrio sulfodismutans TaxID=63561 RepID=A0A7K3NH35_9BACT|nr:hypothetical protein [Desulfolutivibrio sulfodismutans]NDY55514.1 hypothetical protein [Desulfolutivibrio sulfodismutans]QLA12902.1 hypothetical protein GD606_11770 [Desulfolutivibrio sulfodismutans DSM 3696]